MRPTRVHNFGTCFVGAQTAERRGLFQNGWIAELFIETLYHYRRQSRYLLHDFVVMPDHIHFFISLGQDKLLSQWIGTFKRTVGKSVKNSDSADPIWQRGFFDHVMRSAERYGQKWEYVRENPVRARLVQAAEDWPYSGEIVPLAYH